MSIVSVDQISPARTATLELSKATAVRKFVVVTNDKDDDEVDVLIANGVPKIGDAHPNASILFCISKTSAQKDGGESARKVWEVTCDYTTLTRDQKRKLTKPLDRPADIRESGRSITRPAFRDVEDGIPILNMAFMPFDPPIEYEAANGILVITKNKPNQGGALKLAYHNAINSDPYLGAAPGTLRITQFDTEFVLEAFGEGNEQKEYAFWPWTVAFEYDENGWDAQPLNQGRHEKAIGPGAVGVISIREDDGNTPVSDPVPLDIDGQVIPVSSLPGAAIYGVNKGGSTIAPARIYKRRPFAALNLLP